MKQWIDDSLERVPPRIARIVLRVNGYGDARKAGGYTPPVLANVSMGMHDVRRKAFNLLHEAEWKRIIPPTASPEIDRGEWELVPLCVRQLRRVDCEGSNIYRLTPQEGQEGENLTLSAVAFQTSKDMEYAS